MHDHLTIQFGYSPVEHVQAFEETPWRRKMAQKQFGERKRDLQLAGVPA